MSHLAHETRLLSYGIHKVGKCYGISCVDITASLKFARSMDWCIIQPGHNNWIRSLVFHPSGKFLLSASDDKTIRVWELATARCVKTIEAHGHFVSTLAWGRQPSSGGGKEAKPNGVDADAKAAEPEKLLNVVASGSVDQTIKIWLP